MADPRQHWGVLGEAGATPAEAVLCRISVTDIAVWPEVSVVLGRAFADISPANTLVAVAALVDWAMLAGEIEGDAIVGSATSRADAQKRRKGVAIRRRPSPRAIRSLTAVLGADTGSG